MTSEPIRVGLIGAGRIAAVHAAAYERVSGGVIITCTDPVDSAANSMAERYGFAIAPSFESILEDPDIDAVLLATPNALHADQTIAAIHAGKHVFCQKPIALRVEDGEQVVAAVAASDRVVQFGFMLRFTPPIPQLRTRMMAGELGSAIASQSAIFGWEPVNDWFYDPQKGGGVILDTVVHFADLVTWLLGRAVNVYADGGAYKLAGAKRLNSPDNAVLTIRHESGAVSTMYGSWTAGRGNFALTVYGTDGSAGIDITGSQSLTLFNNPPADSESARGWLYPDLFWEQGYAGEQQYFVDRIGGRVDGSEATTAPEALDALRLVVAAQQSLDEKRVVELA